MASGKKQAKQQSTLELLLGISPSANRWLALYTVAPGANSAGTEVSDSGYARQAVTFGAVTGTGPSQSVNSAALNFGNAVDGAITVVAFAVCDAANAGNQIYYGTMTSFTVPVGVGIHVAASAITVIET